MSREVSGRFHPSIPLRQIIASKKRQMGKTAKVEITLPIDPYQNVYAYLNSSELLTALGTANDEMVVHENDWDHRNPENPKRWNQIKERIENLGLVSRCALLEESDAENVLQAIELVHDPALIEKLKLISELNNVEEREMEARSYDGIYFHKITYKAALKAVQWTLSVVKSVCEMKYRNGFAIVRPPGHHAKRNEFEGYCYFNNVAIAAEKCIKENYCKKIMIIDFDVHHGNGTQNIFYKRNDILYFSIHRYEHGKFWPNLREGNFDSIGEDEGEGYNINVPLNEIELEDSDYMAIVFNLVLPVAYEYQPELILISAGYDAAMGCPEGQMLLTPGFYSHFVHLLKGIADSRIVMVLEGGYFPLSLSESVALSIKGLLGDPCPILKLNHPPRKSVVDVIHNVKGALYKYWKCFSLAETFEFASENDVNIHEEHVVARKYFGDVQGPPFETSHYYPVLTRAETIKYSAELKLYQKLNEPYKKFLGLGCGYDRITLEHIPPETSHAFENPNRITHILDLMEQSGINRSCRHLTIPKERSVLEHCLNVHDMTHMSNLKDGKLTPKHDLYTCEGTNQAALAAVNVLLSVVDAVINNEVSHGVALIRPPGHHACRAVAQGFCFLNNVAIAAKYAKTKYNVKRILIVDFDIHHGNGTQDAFYLTDEVLYISIHRFDNGNFYPKNKAGNVNYVGHGPGEGYNVNIAFSGDTMGNSEYLAAFLNIVLPIGYAFRPELVLVSAGFDAGINDPLGGYHVTPEMFGHFIYLLKPLAGGKIVLALEGGYNLHTTSYGMIMCMKALLNQPIPLPQDVFSKPISEHAARTIREVVAIQHQYWPNLFPVKKLSNKLLHYSYEKEFSEEVYDSKKYSNQP